MNIDETRIGKAQRESTRATNRAAMSRRNGLSKGEQARLWVVESAARKRLRALENDADASMEYRMALYGPAITRG
jgi:hypothetical protein